MMHLLLWYSSMKLETCHNIVSRDGLDTPIRADNEKIESLKLNLKLLAFHTLKPSN